MDNGAQNSTGKLVMVRHGESHGNVGKRLETRVPGPSLTERGTAQAARFGAAVAGSPRLFCSAALRARQTAEQIESVVGGPVIVLDGVYEVQAGNFEGVDTDVAHQAFHQTYQRWHSGELDLAVPGGEAGNDVLDRFLPVLEDLRTRYLTPGAGTDVVLVSHGMAMRLAAGAIGGVPRAFAASTRLDFTQTIELTPRYGPAAQFLGWGCTRWGHHVPPFGDIAT
ncbi:histidine phosphatase family protein [Nocardia sp. NPDC058114]|uniref:histidine phosphatase family protein n=1 Tax=Nocardia sp. NPDC058114 TaxID=3346346 RepID=UPI0036DAEFD5